MTKREPTAFDSRGADLRGMTPDLVAQLRLYPTAEGGKAQPAYPGWGCPCKIEGESSLWDAWPLLGDEALLPGEDREVGFVFMRPEGAAPARKAGHFHLWKRRLIGEAWVVG